MVYLVCLAHLVCFVINHTNSSNQTYQTNLFDQINRFGTAPPFHLQIHNAPQQCRPHTEAPSLIRAGRVSGLFPAALPTVPTVLHRLPHDRDQ